MPHRAPKRAHDGLTRLRLVEGIVGSRGERLRQMQRAFRDHARGSVSSRGRTVAASTKRNARCLQDPLPQPAVAAASTHPASADSPVAPQAPTHFGRDFGQHAGRVHGNTQQRFILIDNEDGSQSIETSGSEVITITPLESGGTEITIAPAEVEEPVEPGAPMPLV